VRYFKRPELAAQRSCGAATHVFPNLFSVAEVPKTDFFPLYAVVVGQLDELGGVRLMVLNHRDDVADHRRFRVHFDCERVIHCDDVETGTADIEIQIAGQDVVTLVNPDKGFSRD
jgi:hypothetical protein